MFSIKKIIFILILSHLVLYLFPQTSVTISEYGAYYIDNETIKKIPSTIEFVGIDHWRNYIIFSNARTYLIYNIENGAVSDYLLRSAYRIPLENIGFIPLRNDVNNNIIFYNSGVEYELDPVTLITVRTHEWSRNTNVYDVHNYLRDQNGHIIRWENTEDQWHGTTRIGQTYRFFFNEDETEFTDIILSQNINIFRDIYLLNISNQNRQFVFIINDTNYAH